MTSEKKLEWREQQKGFIEDWKGKMENLRLISFIERWGRDKLEMEILQLIEDQELKDIFIFAKFYIDKYRSGHFRKFMSKVCDEIEDFGTLEPSFVMKIQKGIATTRRKMR